MALGLFGIDSGGFSLVVNLMLVGMVAVWFATIYWAYADASRRMDDPMLITCAWGASLFPFVGALVYLLVRPPEYLEDVRERELEMQAAEARLHDSGVSSCPQCDAEVHSDFVRCPHCQRKLKEACASCRRALEEGWRICPYCEAEVRRPEAKRPRRRPSTRRGEDSPKPAARRSGEDSPKPAARRSGEDSPKPAARRSGEDSPKPAARRSGEDGAKPTRRSGEERAKTTAKSGEDGAKKARKPARAKEPEEEPA